LNTGPSYDPAIADALGRGRRVARELLAPRAEESDQAAVPPAENVRALAVEGLLGLNVPRAYGGLGALGAALREHTETLAAACGVTTFVQGQHQSACAFISAGASEPIKERLLPPMATGDLLGAVAFSHLRRPGPPAVRATPVAGGFVLDGTAPWVTGWGLMRVAVMGGTLPDDRLLYAVIPLEESEHLCASPPMRLCAMSASATVAVTLRGLFVPETEVLKTITREQMAATDAGAILLVTPQPFGVTRASIALLRDLADRRDRALFRQVAETLERELEEVRARTEHWIGRTTDPDYAASALSIRAWAVELGVRAAHAALAASGGSGNALDHPAQRLVRESVFYTLVAQTSSVQAAVLQRLRDRSWHPGGGDGAPT